MTLSIIPVGLSEAQEFVLSFHRHNKPPIGHVFSIGVSDGTELVGVAICGRPVARMLDDGRTLEVTRCCVTDSAPKGTCSFLWKVLRPFSYVPRNPRVLAVNVYRDGEMVRITVSRIRRLMVAA